MIELLIDLERMIVFDTKNMIELMIEWMVEHGPIGDRNNMSSSTNHTLLYERQVGTSIISWWRLRTAPFQLDRSSNRLGRGHLLNSHQSHFIPEYILVPNSFTPITIACMIIPRDEVASFIPKSPTCFSFVVLLGYFSRKLPS